MCDNGIDLHWLEGVDVAVTVCDETGVAVYLNDRAARMFKEDGGLNLVGKNLADCHPEPARSTFLALLKDQKPNSYTIEKNGRKKFIHQAPWFKRGKFAGLVEYGMEIPFDLPHFVRTGAK